MNWSEMNTIGGYKLEAVFANGNVLVIVAGTSSLAMDYARELAEEYGTWLHTLILSY